MPASSDSVKVAVRVRPFSQREKNAGSKCIIKMKDKTTTITHPETGDTKSFSFDYSYWSHDSFTETAEGIKVPESNNSCYTDQQRLFRDLGQGVLDNAWQGYNAALFAYGQTGSGKSYSMIGYDANKGIVPITCEELFKVIEENRDDTKQLRVLFSMLEIYNEQVRDLLVKGKPPSGGLKVRQNPKMGFYVEGLKQVPVRSYTEIEKLMESGTFNRTTAATNMNATSSRSHMVITIRFEQVIQSATGQSNTRSSDINLVDLAGSERADSTGAVGDRLKEGSAINQSLSTLGNVISALADVSMGKKKVQVPYRNSVLTKLLQSALGGNSRTIMIAALSPADINYDETLSTLRYADRAKKIQNKAVVNESPTDRLIRELKEENARLMALLKKQGGGDTTDIQRMLEENQKRMGDMQMSWEQRLEQARREWERSQQQESQAGDQKWRQYPYISNVNEDPQLSGIIKHTFCQDCSIIGRTGSGSDAIEIRGLGIQPNHVEVRTDGHSTTLTPCLDSAIVLVNGLHIRSTTHLKHLDRLKLGSGSLFLYVGYPNERTDEQQQNQYDFDYFMTELAEHEGVSVDIATPREHHQHADMTNRILFQDFVDLMPKIAEANSISEELKRNTKFEAIVKSEASHDPKGKAQGKEIIVKVTNTSSRKVWIWSKSKFYNRKDLMDEVYMRSLDGDHVILTRDKDPFWDPVEDIFLGSCHVMLQSLGYCSEIDEHFTLHNYHGKEEAVVQLQIHPCNEKGQLIDEEHFILEPKDMLGRPLNFIFMLPQCMGVRWINEDTSRGVECRFTLPFQKPTKTKDVWHKSYAEFGYRNVFKYKTVTQELLDYLFDNCLVLELWGKQVSEDEQIHSRRTALTDANGHVPTDVLTQLKLKHSCLEEEFEELQNECEQLKRENFKLRQSNVRYEEKVRMMELRASSSKKDRRVTQSAVEPPTQQPALDVEFAKALQNFFRNMRDIQNSFKDMKEFATAARDSMAVNGTKKLVEDHANKISSTEEKLLSSLAGLRQSAAEALKKGRSNDK